MSTYSLRRSKERIKEQQEVSAKEQVFVCEHCGKEYKTEKGLTSHIEQKHKDGE